MNAGVRKWVVLGVAVATLCTTFAAPAAATPIPGENGRIVFTSGRTAGDNLAELFLLPVPFLPGGPLSAPIASSGTEQHRHATWSPDRTKIAYARGPGPAGPFDIFVQDLTQPLSATNPVNITSPNPASNEDRPAWAPNGDYIAFEKDNGVAANRDIVVALPNGGGQTNITNTAGAIEGKPAWDPTSQTIFYEKGNSQAAVNVDIVRRPISFPGNVPTVGGETLAVADSGQSEFQPAISPNGDKICYTHSTNGFNNTADVQVALVTDPPNAPAAGVVVSKDPAVGEYNCIWSPDNTLIAYVHGTFGNGRLVAHAADGSDPIEFELAQDPGANNFDGNPDWAPDGRPQCPNSSVSTTNDQPLTIAVECTDTGPEYEQSNVREFITEQPQNGTTEQEFAGDPITYTPDANFVGADFIEIRSFDEFGFGGDTGTIAITVSAPDGGGNGGGDGADETPPVLTLSGKKVQRLAKRVKLGARCDEDCNLAVAGKLVVRTKRKAGAGAKKSFKLRRVTRELSADQRQAIKLKLSKKARRAARKALRRGGKANAKLNATAADAAGNETTGKRRVSLKLRRAG